MTHRGARAYGTVDSLDSSYRLQCREDGRVLWAKLGSFDWEEGTNQHTVLHVPDDEVEEGTDNAILNPLIDRANSGREMASALRDLGNFDQDTMVEFSVTVYYTRWLSVEMDLQIRGPEFYVHNNSMHLTDLITSVLLLTTILDLQCFWYCHMAVQPET